MKKIISVLAVAIVCLFAAMPAQAQLKWGVKGGLNFNSFSVDYLKDFGDLNDNSTGFFIGPMAELSLPVVGMGVDAALLYSQKGDGAFKQQNVEVPINLKFNFGAGSLLAFYLAAGPDFSYDLKEKEIVDRQLQVALNLGAGVKLVKHLQIGVTYQLPLGDSFKVGNVVGVQNKNWQLSLAYIF